jgi:hypothetical protein
VLLWEGWMGWFTYAEYTTARIVQGANNPAASSR